MSSSEFGVTPSTVPGIRLGAEGIFWAVWACAWTAVLLGGMLFLHARRAMPVLRVRGLALSFAAVTLLHCYWLIVQLGYIFFSVMPEVAEFWIMSIWLPFGIALFHASNSRFLHVANAQKRYVTAGSSGWDKGRRRRRRSLVTRWRMLDYSAKMVVGVSLGMALQLVLTVFVFLVSRKFHPSFGIPGTEVTGTYMEVKTAQGRGWEWWPSVFWQLFWAWIVAPTILWRARGLADTQGWRTQTIACCLSGLHAAPMWLISIYVPAFAPINNVFVPPQWIAFSILMIEIFTIFIPCWEVRKQQSLCQETLASIAQWESRQNATANCTKSLTSSGFSGAPTWVGRGKGSSISVSTDGSILTMNALEHTLAKNPEPLQSFSALRDFSGENVAFLTRIRQWRATYLVPGTVFRDSSLESFPPSKEAQASAPLSRECFAAALSIYIDFISQNSAEFQVNLSSQDFRNLQSIFEPAACVVVGEGADSTSDPATPFDEEEPRANGAWNFVSYAGDIPEQFSDTVFDNAEMSIKYLVLTNTWPKFIRERKLSDAGSSVDCASV